MVELIESLRCLPGVGQKSAQRMALHLLERDRAGGKRLSVALVDALDNIGHCQQCRMYTEQDMCNTCRSPARDGATVCVVETPADVVAVEQSGQYSGHYFVLMGKLSPLDGIGPEQLGIDRLEARLKEGQVTELILATNPTVEGEATAHFIASLAQQYDVEASRIAYGVPVGGELEYVDGGTLAHAFSSRKKI